MVATGEEEEVGEFLQVKGNRLCHPSQGAVFSGPGCRGPRPESACFLLLGSDGSALETDVPSFHLRGHKQLSNFVPVTGHHSSTSVTSTGLEKAWQPVAPSRDAQSLV